MKKNKNSLTLFFIVILFSCKSFYKNNDKNQKYFLFIGNSLTYWNNMPQTYQKMLTENSINMKVEQITYPGVSLKTHVSSFIDTTNSYSTIKIITNEEHSPTILKVKSRSWDFIMLQNNSYEDSSFLISVKTIAKNIEKKQKTKNKKQKTKILLYQNYTEKILWSQTRREKELQALKDTFNTISRSISGTVIPIGEIFDMALSIYPQVDMYDSNRHPTKIGSMVIVVSIFIELYSKKPFIKNIKDFNLSEEDWKLVNKIIDKFYEKR